MNTIGWGPHVCDVLSSCRMNLTVSSWISLHRFRRCPMLFFWLGIQRQYNLLVSEPSGQYSHQFRTIKLKRQYEDTLDGREDGMSDIALIIHMLACVVLSTVWHIPLVSKLKLYRLDAISMTMFMHNVGTNEGKIPALHEITNPPTGDYFTTFMEISALIFPSILLLPNPIKRYAGNLIIWDDRIRSLGW